MIGYRRVVGYVKAHQIGELGVAIMSSQPSSYHGERRWLTGKPRRLKVQGSRLGNRQTHQQPSPPHSPTSSPPSSKLASRLTTRCLARGS